MIPKKFAPPTTAHLARAYYEMAQLGAAAVGAKRPWPYRPGTAAECLAICGELSRDDPRLFQILLQYFSIHWEAVAWYPLRQATLQVPAPQVFGVIGALLDTWRPNIERRNCFQFLLADIRPVPLQFFYRHLYKLGGTLANRAMDQRLREFEQWGFIAAERPILDQAKKSGVGQLSTSARRALLRTLLTAGHPIQINEYLKRLPHALSRQQALADLRALPGIRRTGHGRGATWSLPHR